MKTKGSVEINGVKVAESATLETFTVNPEKLRMDISRLAKTTFKMKDAILHLSTPTGLMSINLPQVSLSTKDDKPS